MCGGGNSHPFGSFCYLFPTGRVHSSAFIFSRLQLLEIYIYCRHLFWWSFHDHPIIHSRLYGFLPVKFCIPYGTSAKPSFSPYGFHFYTTTVRSFECNTPKEYTVRYNTSLSPTRGGGSSPSGSIPRPSPLVTRARMCSHSLTISNLTLPRCHGNFRVSKSFESHTVVRYLHCTGFLSYRTGFS